MHFGPTDHFLIIELQYTSTNTFYVDISTIFVAHNYFETFS